MFLCEEADDRFVSKVSGPIDSHATDNFQVALNQALASATKAVVIDLSESELICSQGYGKLLITNSDLKGQGRELQIVGCSEHLRDSFHMLKLDSLLDIRS